ncbi:YTH domain-containing protein 1-like isoform X1 [Senna tora]|uniref:YTH domain-containing protein 1-like isoform X1 n=1 Tax=Senna tora TaxID=362788 RepID=A0A834WF40_9FABA|nr:YTH domain-containing protein 1-like isoform X1 [Senna tora]
MFNCDGEEGLKKVVCQTKKMDLFRNPSSSRFESIIGTAKLVLMSMGIVTTLFLFKVSVIPCAFDFLLSTFPRLWVSARTWFSPPFVYIIVNFIIITIAASSNFHHHKTIPFSAAVSDGSELEKQSNENSKSELDDSASSFDESDADPSPGKRRDDYESPGSDVTTDYAVSGAAAAREPEPEKQSNGSSKSELDDSASSSDKSDADPSPEKCRNDYASLDSDDTLDATWRAIMEGQGRTAAAQLKKSDTWGARIAKAEAFEDEDEAVAWARKELRKSETFNDTASLRREKSISSEELKRRAEAFIEKFNMEMKLQRMESEQRLRERVKRGVYCG